MGPVGDHEDETMGGEGQQLATPALQGDGGVRRGKGFGRRYTGVVGDPVDAEDASGHVLRITGPIIWCNRCGRYAMRRLRRSLKNKCVGEATAAYATRLARLRAGRHPLTNVEVV